MKKIILLIVVVSTSFSIMGCSLNGFEMLENSINNFQDTLEDIQSGTTPSEETKPTEAPAEIVKTQEKNRGVYRENYRSNASRNR